MAFGDLIMIFTAVLISNRASVCKAENAVSVQTGSSVQLDIQPDKLLPFNTLVWMNHESENIVTFIKKTIETEIINGAVFNESTFSLTLKNIQKTDSGLYTAKIFGSNNINVAKYRVSVIDPVDSPVLNWNIIMITVNSCIMNVSCSGHDRTIREIYHSNNCTHKENISSEIQTLTLYCKEDIVVCNYSNPVSWKNDTIQIKHLCKFYQNENQQTTGDNNSYFPLHWLIVIVISASLLILVATTLIYSSYKKNDKGVPQNDSTIYAQVQPKSKVQRPLEMLEKSANPQTVYGFTQEHRHPHNTSQTMSSSEIPVETQKNNHPRTTYSTIGPPKTSLYTETDQTVYSVVCKSSNGKMPVY
ncbi:CD48 antigen-like isoform X1 [Carassius auratus]|uniref:CD48 antigen-like isoform X1 n=1 Tax=Carassius auratus TaxID=7957 RepID=A0A6P6QQG4_CARAU|nr:CD48 antigen-like isoform X1 [Carassius auratus]XP_026135617.1 CD48 antigen-like isoform X1 [Carassius auratus]